MLDFCDDDFTILALQNRTILDLNGLVLLLYVRFRHFGKEPRTGENEFEFSSQSGFSPHLAIWLHLN